MKDLLNHPIRAFALLCVAAIAVYIGYMGYRLNETLSGPGWCRTALGAEKASSTEGAVKGLDACVVLLQIQLKSIATNSHILFGVMAGCLLVLVVIVLAGGKVDFRGPGGWGGGITSPGEAAAVGAQKTAEAAQETADAITTEATAAPPLEPPNGPGMPEPKP